MSDLRQEPPSTGAGPDRRRDYEPPQSTGWTGMAAFGAMMLIMLGAFQATLGLVAIFDPGYYLVGRKGLVVSVDYTTWGWVHLGIGLMALATGIGLNRGAMWARALGITIALVSAVVNFAFIAAFPFWSVAVITLDTLIIYAIATHGAELKQIHSDRGTTHE